MTFISYDERAKKELNESAITLLAEFAEHFHRERITHPNLTKTQIFEPWAMNKLSNLQVAVLHMSERLLKLESEREMKRRKKCSALSSDIPSG